MARNETISLFWVACSDIACQDWVRKHRPAAFNDAVRRAAGDQFFGCRCSLHPVLQGGKCIEFSEPRTSSAVVNSRNEKEPEEVFGLLAPADKFHHALVVTDRRRRHNRAIGPPMPQKNFSASFFEGTQVNSGRIIDSSCPSERSRVVVEVEFQGVGALTYFIVCQVFQILLGKIEIGSTRSQASARGAKEIPAYPLGLSAG